MTTKTIQEYHTNGNLKYEETKLFINANDPRAKKGITMPDGRIFIRIGENKKYFSNGKLQWRLVYEDGEVVRNKCENYNKSGESLNK